MKKTLYVFIVLFVAVMLQNCQKGLNVMLVSSTEESQWNVSNITSIKQFQENESVDLELDTDEYQQTIDGFGGCFNELGWEALSVLDQDEKEEVFQELFSASGCNFTICRMPIGANDFALNWYSLNDSVGDYEMKYFNIDRDKTRLIPYIKAAMMYNPQLKVWGSPWCPPAWMKENGYYACSPSEYNDLDPSLPRNENGLTNFIMNEKTLNAYATYLLTYVKVYREQGVNVYAVHVQNEPHSCQSFPSCLWKGTDLKNFIRDHLGPTFDRNQINAEIWYSTFERPYEDEFADELDMLFSDDRAMTYVKGMGFQWAGKKAITAVHKMRSDIKLMHTESECGDGTNSWEQAEYIFDLFRHYFENGAHSQMYWNMILSENPGSPWGWPQNSMITINSQTRSVRYNPEFYVMKHISHFVKPGARKLAIRENHADVVAFENVNSDVIVIVNNQNDKPTPLKMKLGSKIVTIVLQAHSFNTLQISNH